MQDSRKKDKRRAWWGKNGSVCEKRFAVHLRYINRKDRLQFKER